MEKWWDNPTAAVGALMGEKAQAVAECQITKKLQAEYERGLQEGKENAVVHAHWEMDEYGDCKCSACGEWQSYPENYCPECGAKMDEEGAE